jgi:hypothetical protein
VSAEKDIRRVIRELDQVPVCVKLPVKNFDAPDGFHHKPQIDRDRDSGNLSPGAG